MGIGGWVKFLPVQSMTSEAVQRQPLGHSEIVAAAVEADGGDLSQFISSTTLPSGCSAWLAMASGLYSNLLTHQYSVWSTWSLMITTCTLSMPMS
jgi:hypothetical protein